MSTTAWGQTAPTPPAPVMLPFVAAPPASPTAKSSATVPPAIAASSAPAWQSLGRSLEGRPIEMAQFGDGARQVVVIGPLEGDLPEGVDLVTHMAEHFARFPRSLEGVRITLVRDPNPDGHVRGVRANAQGVELNRNFATAGWQAFQAGDRSLSGRAPDSEPESRILVDLLRDTKPDLVVLVTTGERQAALRYAGPAEAMMRQLSWTAKVQVTPAIPRPGALATLIGEYHLPTLLVELAPRTGGETNWTAYRRTLLSLVNYNEAARNIASQPTATPPQAASPNPTATGPLAAGPAMPTPALAQTALAPLMLDRAVPSAVGQPGASPVLRYEDLARGKAVVTIDRGQATQMASGANTQGASQGAPQREASASQPPRRPSLTRIPVVRIETVSEHSRVARTQQPPDSQLPQRPIPLYDER